MIRAKLVEDLVQEILGPRQGAQEILDPLHDPREEYQVGTLFPAESIISRDPDSDAELLGQAAGADEDDDDEVMTPPISTVGSNYRRIPSSFGISFALKNKSDVEGIQICATWARYNKEEGIGWRRQPRYQIFKIDSVRDVQHESHNEVRLTTKFVERHDGSARVSFYLSSIIRPSKPDKVNTEEIIFQPELRVKLANPESIVELGEGGFSTSDEEWRVSMAQYDQRKVLARGHLCGVYWSEIDPQVEQPPESPEGPPFQWIDGRFFLETGTRLEEFFKADLRTDFCPMYSAPSPSFDWPADRKPAPELSAANLSNCRSQEELSRLLNPLIMHYSAWLEKTRSKIGTNPIKGIILKRHEAALERIRNGLSFIASNRNAFLAFLFMNRVMNLQSSWGKGELKWRPFQLAFILLALRSSVNSGDENREIADILWFPTGGGKTEAYLGLAAFTMAYRRLGLPHDQEGHPATDGSSVISRYTLRLLTIQQFRRALKMICACEVMRLTNVGRKIGWRPNGEDALGDWIWGISPFSIGLWVGSEVSPNRLTGERYLDNQPGAVSLLRRLPQPQEPDPAQVLDCPVCKSILAIPLSGLPKGQVDLRLISLDEPKRDFISNPHQLDFGSIKVQSIETISSRNARVYYLCFNLELDTNCTPADFQNWWKEKVLACQPLRLASFNLPVRPGYIAVQDPRRNNPHDFEIRCPNPDCQINQISYREKIPSQQGPVWREMHPLFCSPDEKTTSFGMPIPAITVDEKLYGFPTTMVVATVDKIATIPRLGDADAASLFGRVTSFSEKKGYSRESVRGRAPVSPFSPPDLIIQDELHLLDGPLGSMFGLYECIVDAICSKPKYVASSATIRNASEQVASIMDRRAAVFPPVNVDIEEGFFLSVQEAHPLDEGDMSIKKPGRLFLGVAAPGRAAQTPIIRIWSRLLQTAHNIRLEGANTSELDSFWTLVGYFNAIRELAGGETYWRQDIPQRIAHIAPAGQGRPMDTIEGFRNLSSQTDSSELPGILAALERTLMDGDPLNAVAATSMFGTGVDVDRLSLMVVHGQPKSASSYIQAIGRIGRKRSGLAVVFLRVGKPRDLNHYEYFTGYHRRLPVAVEPISVRPTAPRALEKALGPMLVFLLRNIFPDRSISFPNGINLNDGASQILSISPEAVSYVESIFRRRLEAQPRERRSLTIEQFLDQVRGALEAWQNLANRSLQDPDPLPYKGQRKAVLGAPGVFTGDFAFENAPTSLREVEPLIRIRTTGFGGR